MPNGSVARAKIGLCRDVHGAVCPPNPAPGEARVRHTQARGRGWRRCKMLKTASLSRSAASAGAAAGNPAHRWVPTGHAFMCLNPQSNLPCFYLTTTVLCQPAIHSPRFAHLPPPSPRLGTYIQPHPLVRVRSSFPPIFHRFFPLFWPQVHPSFPHIRAMPL